MWFLLIVLAEYAGPFEEARVLFKAELSLCTILWQAKVI